jgi:hypothetical protein
MMLRATFSVIAVCLAYPAVSAAQLPGPLRKAMEERLAAVWKKDAVTWARLTADEFTLVVPEGRLMSKAERVAALKAEKPQAGHALKHEQVRVYGNTALHRFVDDDEWVLEVWVQQDGRWRVVAAQVNFAKP